jgi:hypothetical protein
MAMLKVFAFLTKREDMGARAFIDYYENNHVPLVLSIAPTPTVYKRNYLVRDDELNREDATIASMSSRSWGLTIGPPSSPGRNSSPSTRSARMRRRSWIGRGRGRM